MMYEWIVQAATDPVIIATKADKIKRSQLQKQIRQTAARDAGASAGDRADPVSRL
jgi:GTP-binding protein EngB required for normal cell division